MKLGSSSTVEPAGSVAEVDRRATSPVVFDPRFAGHREGWPEHGYFDERGAYVLTDPLTPRPWQNLLGNEEYLLSISQLGTGFSTYGGIYCNRVTRSYADSEFDDKRSGRFIYIRDAETGEFFSPTVYPVHTSLEGFDDYACRYEPGAMRWEVFRDGLRVELETIVCPEENTELHRLSLSELSGRSRVLDVFFYLEWAFFGAPEYHGFAITTGFDPAANAHWADVKTHPRYRAHQTGFVTASHPILDYDGRRLAFEGPLGSIQRPGAVEAGRCRNSGAPIIGTATGAVRTRLEIGPSGSASVVFAVGVVRDLSLVPDRARRAVERGRFEAERSEVAAFWNGVAARQVAELPQAGDALRSYITRWLPCQLILNARWARWAAKRGYRDVLQDAAGARLLEPPRARRMILEAVRHQRSDGHAPRCWDTSPWGDHQWLDSRDSPYWLFYSLDAYLRETADFAILDKEEPFVDAPGAVPVWEHLRRALEFLWAQRGEHGWCLIGEGDWNDSINTAGIAGRGESVWLTQALGHGLGLMETIAAASGRGAEIPEFRRRRDEIAALLEANAWDGEWYCRGATDDGAVFGSKADQGGGRIYLLPQAWATIAGVAPRDRALAALRAVASRLETPQGPLLFAPRFEDFEPRIGRISGGGSEADSVYVHGALFYAKALLMHRDADGAWDVIRRLLPASSDLPSGCSGAEPFTCVNAFTGEGWSWPGWSYTGWWTGSPGWLLQILVEDILGARAEFDGLRIDPRLPSCWSSASLVRRFRGAEYHISIHRSPGAPARISVDGESAPSNLLPAAPAGSRVRVECELG